MVALLPHGDYAAGLRSKTDALHSRGTFATGTTGCETPLPRHHGGFAAGIRARLHDHHHRALPFGDFAIDVRADLAPATP